MYISIKYNTLYIMRIFKKYISNYRTTENFCYNEIIMRMLQRYFSDVNK